MTRLFNKLLFCLSLLLIASAMEGENNRSSEEPPVTVGAPRYWIAKWLGWIHAPCVNLCNGYFSEPAILADYPTPLPPEQLPTTITAKNPAVLRFGGISRLSGDVNITQPGRQLTADQAALYRNRQNNRIEYVNLKGHVKYREAGKIVVAHHAHLDFKTKTDEVNQAIYRLAQTNRESTYDGWGTAIYGLHESSGILQFHDVTYSTCSPLCTTWFIKADSLKIDRDNNRGTVRNGLFYLGDTPIFYLPYWTFPIKRERKTGFLVPTMGTTNQDGFYLGLPFYLNLAPNYDALITPKLYTKRGLQGNLLFRFLTETSHGNLIVSYLPNDSEFKKFQETAPTVYADAPFANIFIPRIESDSSNRGYFHLSDITAINPHWDGALELNYVTDDYYFQDLGSNPYLMNWDQLLNQAVINYHSLHWHASARAQAYQTLHLVNQALVQDQYSRLPEIDVVADYPYVFDGLDFHLATEFVNFQHSDDFTSGQPFPTGIRANLNPAISYHYLFPSGFITPQLQFDLTQYSLTNNVPAITINPPGTTIYPLIPAPNDITRAIPTFDIDSGLFFDRHVALFGNDYIQTLEPRLFYLYVPTVSQNDIPDFDTTLPFFDYDQLFRTNRFVGIDRIGDANRVALGLTTRILDGYTGEEKITASIGETYYFQRRNVCLAPDCSDDPVRDDVLSPIAAKLTYRFSPHWLIISNGAWNPNNTIDDNVGINIQYEPAINHIINIGYNFLKDGDPESDGSLKDLNRINLSTAWPLTQHWQFLGAWNYNISHVNSIAYLLGLEYNSCCVSVRLVASRILNNENPVGPREYETQYYFQVQFKGLGTLGTSNPDSLLTTMIPGYQNRL